MSGFKKFEAPETEGQLLARARQLAGSSVAELAGLLGAPVPQEMKRAKGFVGQLLEAFLGAESGSRAEPDFPRLGIELKSLPVGPLGKVSESTFVCTLDLPRMHGELWETSRAWRKLSRVLWVVIEADAARSLSDRRFGTSLLWSPNEEETACLRADWEGVAALVGAGRTSEITAHLGHALQVRPKGAKGSSRRRTLDATGALYDEQPKGFYLRSSFTTGLLQRGALFR